MSDAAESLVLLGTAIAFLVEFVLFCVNAIRAVANGIVIFHF